MTKNDILIPLHRVMIGSCTCLTKTSDPIHHAENCRYKLINEAWDKFHLYIEEITGSK